MGYLLFIPAIFLFAVWLPQANFWLLKRGKPHSIDVNHCIWAIYFWPKGDQKELDLTPNWVPNGLWSQCHNALNHSLQIAENILPRLAHSFSKMWNAPNIQNSYSLWCPLGLYNTSLDAKFSVMKTLAFADKSNHWVKVLSSVVSLSWDKGPKHT